MARTSNRFTKGTGVYECRCCHRATRDTGRGDNEGVRLCAECYDLSGEENHLSDNGEFYDKPANVLALIQAVADKGGDSNVWSTLKQIAMEHQAEIDKDPAIEKNYAPAKKHTGPQVLKQERIAKYVGRIVGRAATKCAHFSGDAPLRIYVEIEFNNEFLDTRGNPFPQAVKAELSKMGFDFS